MIGKFLSKELLFIYAYNMIIECHKFFTWNSNLSAIYIIETISCCKRRYVCFDSFSVFSVEDGSVSISTIFYWRQFGLFRNPVFKLDGRSHLFV